MRDDADCQASSGLFSPIDAQSRLSLDIVLELLANQRRRFALYSLNDSPEEAVQMEALVEEVATLEAGLSTMPLTRDHYLEVASDLHHWHLQVLSDVGVVEVDERSGAIRSHSHPLLETWIKRIRQSELTGSSPRLLAGSTQDCSHFPK